MGLGRSLFRQGSFYLDVILLNLIQASLDGMGKGVIGSARRPAVFMKLAAD